MLNQTPLDFILNHSGNISSSKNQTSSSELGGLAGTVEDTGTFGEMLSGRVTPLGSANVPVFAAEKSEMMSSLLVTEEKNSDDTADANSSNTPDDLVNFYAVSGLLARYWNKKELGESDKSSDDRSPDNAENELSVLSRRKNTHTSRSNYMRIINDITDFIFAEDTPKKADLIIAVGGSYPQIPEKAAELYRKGLAPYILTTGRFTHNLGHFRGVSDKIEIYNKPYVTECDFYHDVLTRNGVPESAMIREDKAEFTRANAELSRSLVDEKGLKADTILVVCKSFHARRCQMFFQSAFDKSEVLMIPVDIGTGEGRNDWFKSEKGIQRILGELKRIGEQINSADITRFAGN